MDVLVADLNAKEDSNFRLFGYVGQVNAEVEGLHARMRTIAAEIDKYQAANEAQDTEQQLELQVLSRALTWHAPPHAQMLCIKNRMHEMLRRKACARGASHGHGLRRLKFAFSEFIADRCPAQHQR